MNWILDALAVIVGCLTVSGAILVIAFAIIWVGEKVSTRRLLTKAAEKLSLLSVEYHHRGITSSLGFEGLLATFNAASLIVINLNFPPSHQPAASSGMVIHQKNSKVHTEYVVERPACVSDVDTGVNDILSGMSPESA